MRLHLITLLGVFVLTEIEPQVLNNFAGGLNTFTAHVYKELVNTNFGNIVICPLSVETVLALMHNGAGGETARQLAAGLYLAENKQINQEIFKSLESYYLNNAHYTLNSANKIYVNQGYQVKNTFRNIAVNVFNADIQNINFERRQQAASEINRWVEEKTQGRIRNLISPQTLRRDSQSLLVNAMYFRGKWEAPFEKRRTQIRDFYINNRDAFQTYMMEQTNYFDYYESSELDAKFLELPYVGENIVMTIVLPNRKEGLRYLEEHIGRVFGNRQYESVRVHAIIPKIRIENTIEFKPILQALGVLDAFEDHADFNDILIGQSLKIDRIIQKTVIEVEEDGTTAAAASYGGGIPLSSNYKPPITHQFIADHPFIFYIKIEDAIVFAGRYSSPN